MTEDLEKEIEKLQKENERLQAKLAMLLGMEVEHHGDSPYRESYCVHCGRIASKSIWVCDKCFMEEDWIR